jgi:hypothetical protein
MPAVELNNTMVREMLGSAVPMLSDYSIGFVLPTATNGALDATLGGSGTLVTIDEVQGILSANHVIKLLRTNRDVGLVLPTASEELHHVSLRSSDFSDYSFCPEGKAENGPDLGLLVPPPDVLATLQARKSFYNISKRQDRMVEAPEPIERGLWVLSGFAGEQTGDRTPEQGFSKVKVFKGSHLAGKLASECKEGNFDYLFFEALYNDLYEGPDSYGGFSGGALWQLIVGPDGSRFRITDILLSGVAFYQSDKRDDGSGQITRHIKCHGRRSLYKALIEKVRAEHPQYRPLAVRVRRRNSILYAVLQLNCPHGSLRPSGATRAQCSWTLLHGGPRRRASGRVIWALQALGAN